MEGTACVVLAAGRGERLRPLTDSTPKPLLPVANRPILEYSLRQAAACGHERVLVNTHYRGDDLMARFDDGRDLGVEILWRAEARLSGPAGALLVFRDVLERYDRALVLSGDGLHDVDLGAFVRTHERSGAALSVVVKEVPEPGRFGVAMLDSGSRLVSFEEKPPLPPGASAPVSCGIYCMELSLLERFPEGEVFDFGAHLIPAMVRAGETVFGYQTDGYWTDVGSFDELLRSSLDVLMGRLRVDVPGLSSEDELHADPTASIATDVSASGRVLVGAGATVEPGVTLVGPVVVGDHSRVGHGAFVRGSVLLPGACIPPGAIVSGGLVGAKG